jgi:hypothetical protein
MTLQRAEVQFFLHVRGVIFDNLLSFNHTVLVDFLGDLLLYSVRFTDSTNYFNWPKSQISADLFWRYPFSPLMSAAKLIEYMVMDIEPVRDASGRPVQHGKVRMQTHEFVGAM